jgi:predicted N-formylglutamate amidohydrolase
MKELSGQERARILERWWWPHRHEVERAVCEATKGGRRGVHVAVHSFTPQLDGVVRNAEVGFLYDSRRSREATFCHRWATVLKALNPDLRVRFNYPYRGSADGLTTWLRRRHPPESYLGIELEFNQSLVGGPGWVRFQKDMAASLEEVVSS